MLWILVQTGHITPHAAHAVNAVNAVNINVQGGGDTLNTVNAVNFSANR